MMIELTHFSCVTDNKTDHVLQFSDGWDSFVDWLIEQQQISYRSKQDASLISPAIYKSDSLRSNKNVVRWAGWCGLDIDLYKDGIPDQEKFAQFPFGRTYDYFCYSTGSSTKQFPKFRLLFPLTRDLKRYEISGFWNGLTKLFRNSTTSLLIDKQTKDYSRMFYQPGNYDGKFNFNFRSNSDRFINPDHIIVETGYDASKRLIDSLPTQYRNNFAEWQRKYMMDPKQKDWTSYYNCPYFPKDAAAQYKGITEEGWYRTIYKFMVETACNAVENRYPITSSELGELMIEFDKDNGGWYQNRPMEREAQNAIDFAYRHVKMTKYAHDPESKIHFDKIRDFLARAMKTTSTRGLNG